MSATHSTQTVIESAVSALSAWCGLNEVSASDMLQGFASIQLTPAYPTSSKRNGNPEVGQEGG